MMPSMVESIREYKIRMETVVCPVCHAANSTIFMRVPDRFRPEPGTAYTLVRCVKCSLVYLNPRPVEESSGVFYESSEYTPFVSTGKQRSIMDRVYVAIREMNNRWKRRQIEALQPERGRLLDVGCGTGEFLQAMHAAGWQVRGVERDAKAAAYAVEQLQLDVVCGSLDTVPLAPASFDVVTMWHVLEHLYQPHKALMQVRDVLRPGGLLVIAVPNLLSLDARYYRQNWVAFDAPRHVQHFSPKSLRSLCEMHSFAHLRTRMLPFDPFFNALMSETVIERRKGASIPGRIVSTLRAGIVANVAFIAGWVTARLQQPLGSSLVYFFRK